MEYVGNVVNGPLGDLFADWWEPIFIVDAQWHVLFQNSAANQFLDTSSNLQVRDTKLCLSSAAENQCLGNLIDSNKRSNGVAAAQRTHLNPFVAINQDWLLSVAALPTNLAVLHPVFVVNLMSRHQLSNTAHTILGIAAGLTAEELRLIDTWLSESHDRHDSAECLFKHAANTTWHRILHKCGVRSPAALLTLLHHLTQLCD